MGFKTFCTMTAKNKRFWTHVRRWSYVIPCIGVLVVLIRPFNFMKDLRLLSREFGENEMEDLFHQDDRTVVLAIVWGMAQAICFMLLTVIVHNV